MPRGGACSCSFAFFELRATHLSFSQGSTLVVNWLDISGHCFLEGYQGLLAIGLFSQIFLHGNFGQLEGQGCASAVLRRGTSERGVLDSRNTADRRAVGLHASISVATHFDDQFGHRLQLLVLEDRSLRKRDVCCADDSQYNQNLLHDLLQK